MDRVEATGVGIAVVAHAALLVALSMGAAISVRPASEAQPIEVSFVEDLALTSSAPQTTASAPAAAPEADPGPVQDSAPAPVPAPTQAPAPERPRPRPTAPPRPGLPNLNPSDFGDDPAPPAPRGREMTPQLLGDIRGEILRQVQPCANRQIDPGPGASRIRVTLNLRLRRDGALAGRPTVVRTSGVNADNARYEDRVKDLAVASFMGCSPLRGLPSDLYQTPTGGWSNINLSYKLPD